MQFGKVEGVPELVAEGADDSLASAFKILLKSIFSAPFKALGRLAQFVLEFMGKIKRRVRNWAGAESKALDEGWSVADEAYFMRKNIDLNAEFRPSVLDKYSKQASVLTDQVDKEIAAEYRMVDNILHKMQQSCPVSALSSNFASNCANSLGTLALEEFFGLDMNGLPVDEMINLLKKQPNYNQELVSVLESRDLDGLRKILHDSDDPARILYKILDMKHTVLRPEISITQQAAMKEYMGDDIDLSHFSWFRLQSHLPIDKDGFIDVLSLTKSEKKLFDLYQEAGLIKERNNIVGKIYEFEKYTGNNDILTRNGQINHRSPYVKSVFQIKAKIQGRQAEIIMADLKQMPNLDQNMIDLYKNAFNDATSVLSKEAEFPSGNKLGFSQGTTANIAEVEILLHHAYRIIDDLASKIKFVDGSMELNQAYAKTYVFNSIILGSTKGADGYIIFKHLDKDGKVLDGTDPSNWFVGKIESKSSNSVLHKSSKDRSIEFDSQFSGGALLQGQDSWVKARTGINEISTYISNSIKQDRLSYEEAAVLLQRVSSENAAYKQTLFLSEFYEKRIVGAKYVYERVGTLPEAMADFYLGKNVLSPYSILVPQIDSIDHSAAAITIDPKSLQRVMDDMENGRTGTLLTKYPDLFDSAQQIPKVKTTNGKLVADLDEYDNIQPISTVQDLMDFITNGGKIFPDNTFPKVDDVFQFKLSNFYNNWFKDTDIISRNIDFDIIDKSLADKLRDLKVPTIYENSEAGIKRTINLPDTTRIGENGEVIEVQNRLRVIIIPVKDLKTQKLINKEITYIDGHLVLPVRSKRQSGGAFTALANRFKNENMLVGNRGSMWSLPIESTIDGTIFSRSTFVIEVDPADLNHGAGRKNMVAKLENIIADQDGNSDNMYGTVSYIGRTTDQSDYMAANTYTNTRDRNSIVNIKNDLLDHSFVSNTKYGRHDPSNAGRLDNTYTINKIENFLGFGINDENLTPMQQSQLSSLYYMLRLGGYRRDNAPNLDSRTVTFFENDLLSTDFLTTSRGDSVGRGDRLPGQINYLFSEGDFDIQDTVPGIRKIMDKIHARQIEIEEKYPDIAKTILSGDVNYRSGTPEILAKIHDYNDFIDDNAKELSSLVKDHYFPLVDDLWGSRTVNPTLNLLNNKNVFDQSGMTQYTTSNYQLEKDYMSYTDGEFNSNRKWLPLVVLPQLGDLLDSIEDTFIPIKYHMLMGNDNDLIDYMLSEVYYSQMENTDESITNIISQNTKIEYHLLNGNKTTVYVPSNSINGSLVFSYEGNDFNYDFRINDRFDSLWVWDGAKYIEKSIFIGDRLNPHLFFEPRNLSIVQINQNIGLGMIPVGTLKGATIENIIFRSLITKEMLDTQVFKTKLLSYIFPDYWLYMSSSLDQISSQFIISSFREIEYDIIRNENMFVYNAKTNNTMNIIDYYFAFHNRLQMKGFKSANPMENKISSNYLIESINHEIILENQHERINIDTINNRLGKFGDLLYDNSNIYNIGIDRILPSNDHGYYDLLERYSTNFFNINSNLASDFFIPDNDTWKLNIYSIYGTKTKISRLTNYLFVNSVKKFYIQMKQEYRNLGLISNNGNIITSFFNSFRLEWDWNFIRWGERNNAGEMPIVMKFYFSILLGNNHINMKYANMLIK